MKRIIISTMLLLLATCLYGQNLTILHLNDTHSHIDPQRSGKDAGMGGVVEQAAFIDSVRVADGASNVILLHAGDFSQGTSYFTELKGDIEIDVLDAMGFDAVCLGNHEFDNGMEELSRRLSDLEVPVVCANYDFTGTPLEGKVKPYVILEKAGVRIGVIGLLTDVHDVVDTHIAELMKYQNPVEVTQRYATMLKDEKGCKLVICLTHLGFENEPYTDVELAAAVTDVDVIVGGHSHTRLDKLKKVYNPFGEPVIVVQDGKWGKEIGKLSVTLKPGVLYDKYRQVARENGFCMDGSWFPYPAYDDRAGWEALLGNHAGRIISQGEKYLDYAWQPIPAVSYLEYERTGNRKIMEDPLSRNRVALNTLMLAELAEGKGRFMDQLVNGVWHMSHLPSWVLSAHLPRQKSKRSLPDPDDQIVDLVSAPTGAQMAVVWHFFNKDFDEIDPVIADVMEKSMKEKILDPCLDTDKFKPNWWLGFVLKKGGVINNWTPWCNADALLCFLLMEKDPVRLEHAIRQSARSVDLFLEYVSQDGACEEGPSYWGHAAGKLYDYLQIMYDASGGKFDMFSDKRIKDMGEYISRSYVQDGWVVNFADASARQGYSPSVIYNYGKAVGSQEMMDFAVHGLAKDDRFKNPTPVFGNDVYRSLESLRTLKNIEDASNEMNRRIQEGETVVSCQKYLRRDVPGFVWYPQTEFCYMRSGDWFVGMKGGHNNESHNHNDIGTFLLYIDGTPVFVDAGVGTYTKKTFGPDRFSIWSMQSDWHNLPMINGSSQVFGAQHRSSDVVASEKKSGGLFRLDIAGGYMDAAECKSWVRQYELKGSVLTITDTYELNKRVSADVENFLVQGEVVIGDDAVLVKNGDMTVRMEYPKGMTPSVDVMELDDPRLSNVWGNNLKRISFTSPADAPVKGKYIFKITELN